MWLVRAEKLASLDAAKADEKLKAALDAMAAPDGDRPAAAGGSRVQRRDRGVRLLDVAEANLTRTDGEVGSRQRDVGDWAQVRNSLGDW